MRFAIVAFGLEEVAEKILSKFPQADIFHGIDDLNTDFYEFVFLMSELGGNKGDKLISALKELKCEVIIFCTTATTLDGIFLSREQAYEIVTSLPQFRGAILSGYLSFEEKVEAAEIILNERIYSEHKI